MTEVSRKDISEAVEALGVKKGDTALVHSSFKSMGRVVGGAEDVIGGLLDVIGEEGTLVFPTFVQKDFTNAYKTWHIDKPSDTGYLTEYFRKREGSIRSDQATHSVAACGRLAEELTKTHGHTHKRFGNMGDTPFSNDSPWEKMYNIDARIVLVGVTPQSVTFRHYAEYLFIEECLNAIKDTGVRESMKNELWCMDKPGPWPHLFNQVINQRLEDKKLAVTSSCGDATFTCYSSKAFVDECLECLRANDKAALWDNGYFDIDSWMDWFKRCKEASK